MAKKGNKAKLRRLVGFHRDLRKHVRATLKGMEQGDESFIDVLLYGNLLGALDGRVNNIAKRIEFKRGDAKPLPTVHGSGNKK